MNLLKAGYEKKVGQVYGVAKKGLYDIKAVPFSHTPHSDTQNKAKDAFVRLNKVASRVVKKMWNYLSLSDKEMYRNNALCQLWKNALIDNSFDLPNLEYAISINDALTINEIIFNPEKFNFSYSAVENNPSEETQNQIIYIAVVTNKCVSKAEQVERGNIAVINSIFDYIDFAYFRVWAFKSVPRNKKWELEGFTVTNIIYVVIVNEVFYVMRWHWLHSPYVENEVLFLPEEPSIIDDEVLFLY